MPVVAFRIGNEPFFTYTLLIDLGLIAAVAILALEGRRRGWGGWQVIEVLTWALVPAIGGGRLAYVASQWLADPAQVGQWRQPWGDGLSFPAALVAGALGLAVLAAWRRRSYVELLGAVAPGLALGQALGWLGAAVHGVSAGVPVLAAWRWAPHLRDLYGVVLPRFPLQYGAALLSLATWAAITWGHLATDRERVACYALCTGLGLSALGWGLERRLSMLAGLSLEQMAYLALGLAGLALALAGLLQPVKASRAKAQAGNWRRI